MNVEKHFDQEELYRYTKKETQLFGKHSHIYSNVFALRPRQEQCVKQTDRLKLEKVGIKVTDGN